MDPTIDQFTLYSPLRYVCRWRIQDFLGVGGANPPGWGPTYDFAKFSQKLHEIERIWTLRGGAFLAPPLRSANGTCGRLHDTLACGVIIILQNHQPCGDKERCKFFDLPSGCRNVDNCAFLHPGQEEVLQVPVCRFYKYTYLKLI